MNEKIEQFLTQVEKPVQYLGNEVNSVHKTEFKYHQCFIFPDLYEIGMSGLAVQILYEAVNAEKDLYIERAFMPREDMCALLKQANMPLFSLETWTPLKDFNLLSFSLGYEACFTTVLEMLDMANIPVKACDRNDSHPLISAGGSCTYNPKPMSAFIDFFYVGEGEDIIVEVSNFLKENKALPKQEQLKRLAEIKGIYVPTVHKGQKIEKRIVQDLNKSNLPKKPLVSYLKLVHDRLITEIQRGCTRGCRFCQAGIIYRPVRERSLENNMALIKSSLKNTGYDELSLSSLSSSDYSQIRPLIKQIMQENPDMNISLPSLRIDNFSLQLANDTEGLRKSSFTFAPEAGSQRMRDIINKGVTEEDIMTTALQAFKEGWRNLKFYFMIGLPFETLEDVEAIYTLCRKVHYEAKKIRRDAQITVSISNFVPKPHTPFQWVEQMNFEVMEERHNLLKDLFKKSRGINLKIHSKPTSYLEGVLSRGDEKIGALIFQAWKNGAKLDAWREHFYIQHWKDAAETVGVDLNAYLKARDISSKLPWDFIDVGVSKAFYLDELQKAEAQALTADCREQCIHCGVCIDSEFSMIIDK